MCVKYCRACPLRHQEITKTLILKGSKGLGTTAYYLTSSTFSQIYQKPTVEIVARIESDRIFTIEECIETKDRAHP
jgi:hypothetical protein